jgi:hypothetical protein
MTFASRYARRLLPLAAIAAVSTFAVQAASAQFSPPSTIFGSVTDSAGPVPENLPVEAYIGDKLCGTKGKTQFTGDGAARVTVYFVESSTSRRRPVAAGRRRSPHQDRRPLRPQTVRWKAGSRHACDQAM